MFGGTPNVADLSAPTLRNFLLRHSLRAFLFIVLANLGMTTYLPMTTKVFAQRAIPDNSQTRPTLISIDGKSFGSGFYLNTEDAVWLITAKHVLFDDKGVLLGQKAESLGYNEGDDLGTVLEFDLKVLTAAGFLRSHKSADAAVIKVASATEPADKQRTLTPVAGVNLKQVSKQGITGTSNYLKFDDVAMGNDVIVYGYPNSIGLRAMPQIDQKQPLLRKGIVAGRNSTQHTIIIDCPSFNGNSGGPVVQINNRVFEVDFKIIGIVSQFVPFDNSGWSAAIGGNATILNSGYSVVTPMDPVMDLISQVP